MGAYLLALSLQVQAQWPPRKIWALVINGIPAADVETAVRSDGPWIPVAALEHEGLINLPAGRRETTDNVSFVSLASLAPGIRFVLDDDRIELRLTVAPEFLPRQDIAIVNQRPANLVVSRPPSAFFNYIGTYRTAGGSDLLAQAAVSGAGWSFYNTAAFRSDDRPLRGVTTLSFDQPGSRRQWSMGDVLGGASPLGSAPLVGGVSVATESRLDPYYTTFTMPQLTGSTVSASTATVYVSGTPVSQFPLRPGPFLVDQLPISSGLGRLDLQVQDASGATQTISLRYYLGTSVLRRGMQEYRYLAGAERTFDGSTAEYGRLLGTAFHRVGVSDAITIGYQAEGDKTVFSVGPLLDVRVWRLGTIGFAASGGRNADSDGVAGSFTYEFQSRVISLQSRLTKLWRGYANLYVEPLQNDRVYLDGTASVPVLRRGTLTLRWLTRSVLPDAVPYLTHLSIPGVNRLGLVPTSVRLARDNADLRREAGIGGSVALSGRLRLYGLANRVSERGDRWWDGFLSLSVSLGARTAATVTGSRSRETTNVTTDIYRAPPLGPGIGFRAAGDADSGRAVGELVLQHQRGGVRLLLDRAADGRTDGAFEISGAIGTVGRRVGLMQVVDDGFALVHVPKSPDVRVFANHQQAGRTNGSGVLFVPALQSYLSNTIGIVSDDVPAEVMLGATERVVSPATRGGVLVRFDATVIRSFTGLLRVRQAEKEIVPAYGEITVDAPGGPFVSPLNGDGYFFLEQVPAGSYVARIGYGGGDACAFTVQIPASSATTIDLGILVCRKTE